MYARYVRQLVSHASVVLLTRKWALQCVLHSLDVLLLMLGSTCFGLSNALCVWKGPTLQTRGGLRPERDCAKFGSWRRELLLSSYTWESSPPEFQSALVSSCTSFPAIKKRACELRPCNVPENRHNVQAALNRLQQASAPYGYVWMPLWLAPPGLSSARWCMWLMGNYRFLQEEGVCYT